MNSNNTRHPRWCIMIDGDVITCTQCGKRWAFVDNEPSCLPEFGRNFYDEDTDL